MISCFVKEQKRYSFNDLMELFGVGEEKTIEILRQLRNKGIVKLVKNISSQTNSLDLVYEDEEVAENSIIDYTHLYIFKYVGIVYSRNYVIKCFPKYIEKTNELESLKKIVKVLKKYNSSKQIIPFASADQDGKLKHNKLMIMFYMLEDYHLNGPYVNTKEILEVNKVGEILWEKTVNETFTLLSNDKPYYPNLITKKTSFNEFDYFRRLHDCIITNISNQLETAGLLELFEYTGVNTSDEQIENFGDIEYVKYKISQELQVQYFTRKQILLKMLYAYLVEECRNEEIDELSFFGTSNFEHVWEVACQAAFINEANVPIKNLDLISYKSKYGNLTLLQLIDKPVWTKYSVRKAAEGTLIPDIINLAKLGNETYFNILDAKYYVPIITDNKLSGQPGIADISKQYLYQLAYREFLLEQGIVKTSNYFIFPSEHPFVEVIGKVRLSLMHGLGFELTDIQCIEASANTIYDCYLNNKTINFGAVVTP